MALSYRIRQFIHAVRQPATPPDLGELASLLSNEQTRLFVAMAVVDQNHCVRVARALAADGHTEPDLLRAALLHDAGKSLTHIAVWERVVHVLLARLSPRLAERAGTAQPNRIGHGLYILARHARLGADLAAQAGCPPATVAFLRGAGDPQQQDALRQADNAH